MPKLLTCPNCNAPLPPPSATHVTCFYCRATSAVANGVATRVIEPSTPAAPAPRKAREHSRENSRERAVAAYKAVMEQRGAPERAAMHAAMELVAVYPTVSAQEMAVGAVALARWFDSENGTNVASDAAAMKRLLEAYAKAVVELRATSKTTINLPFLAVSESGPLHLEREVDARTLASLGASPRYTS